MAEDVPFVVLLEEVVVEVELDDVAGPAAAVDAAPLAAVAAMPRAEEIGRVACDAGLEGEQRRPLGRDAAPVCSDGGGGGGG